MWLRPCLEVGYLKPDFTTLEDEEREGYRGTNLFSCIAGAIVGGVVVVGAYVGLRAYSGSTRSAATKKTGSENNKDKNSEE